jgi:hypothetical protein
MNEEIRLNKTNGLKASFFFAANWLLIKLRGAVAQSAPFPDSKNREECDVG